MWRQLRTKGWIIGVVIALVFSIAGPGRGRAATGDNKTPLPQAAFVKGGDLWVQTGESAKPMTKGQSVHNPKWSFDNQWIAYSAGENEQELWVLHVSKGESHLVSPKGGSWRSFQWAPDRNRLAFRNEQQLFTADPDQPDKHVEAAREIGNYSWLPDGSGMLVSSASKLLPDSGWTPVRILKLPLSAIGEPGPEELLYTLPKPSDAFLAVGTSIFRWSADGRWIAFLATPTASLSADSNALCVLSSDGKTFRKIDDMVRNEQWFAWAGEGEKLAYIGGVGREASSNKRLKVVELPNGTPIHYTPTGYVDQGFAWDGPNHIIVSRAREMKPTNYGPAVRPFPSLVDIELTKGRTDPVTHPSDRHGDYQPTLVTVDHLAWVRSNRQTAEVRLSEVDGDHDRVWIPSLDLGANYYEQWNWSTVLDYAHPAREQ
ncbi:hypothetical protein [Paenibacillus sp. HJGM_3]|uniref:hypothetical protein n=1 Tax=Paenibacillus sp. HJGM_3 TaxID=3379816 RepID=UPI0038599E4E